MVIVWRLGWIRFTIIERVVKFEHRKRQVKCKISDFLLSKGKFIAHTTYLKPPMLDSHQNPFRHHHGHHEEDFLLQFSLPAKAEEDTVAARSTPTPKIHGRSGSPSRATMLRLQSLPFFVTKCSNMFSGIGPWTWTIMESYRWHAQKGMPLIDVILFSFLFLLTI